MLLFYVSQTANVSEKVANCINQKIYLKQSNFVRYAKNTKDRKYATLVHREQVLERVDQVEHFAPLLT
jgi:hypothetical protein